MNVVAVSPTLVQFLEDAGTIVENAMGWMTDAFTKISANPILLAIVFGLPLVGLGIGLLSRLIRV